MAFQRTSPQGTNAGPCWPLEIPYGALFALGTLGVRWDKELHLAYWRGETLPLALRPLAAPPWSWAWQQGRRLNPGQSVALPAPDGPLWTPRPHQATAVQCIGAAHQAGLPGFVLADDVGVGKTLEAVAWLNRQVAKDPWVLIVTTASALAHWRRTLVMSGSRNPNVLIINYEQLSKILGDSDSLSKRRKGRSKRLASRGSVPKFDFVIFDEAHKGKNPGAARSIAMRRLGAKAKFVLWLSATIGRDPIELSYLAPLLTRLTGGSVPVDTLADFGQWCIDQRLGVKRGAYGSFTRADKGDDARRAETEAGLERVHGLLFKPHPERGLPAVALRRLPQDIAGWPEMERQLWPEAVSAEAAERLDGVLGQVLREELSAGPPGQRGKEAKAASLARIIRLRQAFSQARLGATVEHIGDLLENGKQVAVSVAFLDTMRSLAAELEKHAIPVALIYGGMGKAEREEARTAFQTGRATVCLFTVEEAISLHQGEVGGNDVGRVMLVHDVRWSPLQMTQIEGRCHRDGALAPVRWLYAADTFEQRLVASVLDGVVAMKTMMGDDTDAVRNVQVQLFEIARQAAPGGSTHRAPR